jgi:eukaryotic-like serine/threonine-protein kinase
VNGNNSRAPLVGRRLLDQFVLVERIGAGGMGEVYLAEQPSMGRRAVVKVVRSDVTLTPDVATRFNLEARFLAALSHPNIVTIYNYGADRDLLFFAMEFVDGKNLETLVGEEGPFSAARAVAAATQICAALSAAHAQGFVHRDLKPANVMMTAGGHVKVLDFGTGKWSDFKLTAPGEVFGTVEYMSPEQIGGLAIDGRADLYSLGVTLFELLAGRLPFERATPQELMIAHLKDAPPSLAELAPDVPPALAALVMRLLSKSPDARPATAAETAELFEASLEGATAVGGKRSSRRARGSGSPVGGGGFRVAVAGALVGAVALGVLAAVVIARRAPPPQDPAQQHLEQQPPKLAPPPPKIAPPPPQNDAPTPPKIAPPPPQIDAPAPPPKLAPPPPESPSADALERQFMTMPSRLTARERRQALRALDARIANAPGDHAAMRVRALEELIRQQSR